MEGGEGENEGGLRNKRDKSLTPSFASSSSLGHRRFFCLRRFVVMTRASGNFCFFTRSGIRRMFPPRILSGKSYSFAERRFPHQSFSEASSIAFHTWEKRDRESPSSSFFLLLLRMYHTHPLLSDVCSFSANDRSPLPPLMEWKLPHGVKEGGGKIFAGGGRRKGKSGPLRKKVPMC